MINVIKMDLYRMFKSRMTWIILLIVGVISVLNLFMLHYSYQYMKNNPEIYSTIDKDVEDKPEAAQVKHEKDPLYQPDGIFDINYLFSNMIHNTVLGLFIAIFAVLFAGSENSTGFIKNIAGQSSIRYRTILSKCFILFLFSLLAFILQFIITLVCSQAFWGYIKPGEYSLTDTIVFFITQLFLNLALGALIICISELITNQAVSMAISVIVSIGAMRMLTGILDRLVDLGKYSFTSLLLTVNIATISLPYEPDTYHLAWTISGVFLVMAAAISILIMQKKDIR